MQENAVQPMFTVIFSSKIKTWMDINTQAGWIQMLCINDTNNANDLLLLMII